MTCPEARDQLSSLLDDALAGAERQALEGHMAACPECGRELAQLRATVAMLGRLPAPHAPAGFVDRVMAATHRPPWPRRVLDALFVPLRVKLPLEAAAVLVVGVSALYVYQHTPEVRELARQENPGPAPAPAFPVAPRPPSPGAETPAASTRAVPPTSPGSSRPEAKRAPADSEAREQARPAPPSTPVPDSRDVRATSPATPMAKPPDPPASPTLPATSPESRAKRAEPLAKTTEPLIPPAETPAKKDEALAAAGRSDAAAPARSSTGSEEAGKSTEPSAQRDAAGAGAQLPPSAARSRPPSVVPPVAEPRGNTLGAAPASPPPGRSESATAKAPVARRLMRAVDASGRLVVPAREPAESALDALLGRLGARRVERRLEGDRGMLVIDVLVPGARYRELIEGLGQIGRWVTEHEPGTLPAQLRVEVAVTVEP